MERSCCLVKLMLGVGRWWFRIGGNDRQNRLVLLNRLLVLNMCLELKCLALDSTRVILTFWPLLIHSYGGRMGWWSVFVSLAILWRNLSCLICRVRMDIQWVSRVLVCSYLRQANSQHRRKIW
jgi:hypothetical protein